MPVSSAFSIEVSPSRPGRLRDVSLRCYGHTYFSCTHREVQWAVLARFLPAGGGGGVRSADAAIPVTLEDISAASRRRVAEGPGEEEVGQEYLCVFHREELKDFHGRFTLAHPQTICSAYQVKNGTHTEYVLHDITPTLITPGAFGVFVHGKTQNMNGHADALLFDGQPYYPATDMWWMASPLVVMPVYVCPHVLCCDSAEEEHTPCSSHAISSVMPMSSPHPRCTVGAVVLHHFSCGPDSCYAVTRSGEGCIGLARVVPHYCRDCVTWEWMPQTVELKHLSSNNAAISVTVSEHESLEKQVLFLYDAQQRVVHVLRTPNLITGHGDLVRLFSLPNGGFPVVLPCMRHTTPQPILVCNVPQDNMVSLFSPMDLALTESASASTVIAEMKLPAAPLADDFPSNPTRQYSSQNRVKGPLHRDPTVAPPVTSLHPIESISSQSDSTLVFSYSSSASSPKLTGSPQARRSRCEVRVEQSISFPSMKAEEDVLLLAMLEALEASIGRKHVAEMEYHLIRCAWDALAASRSVSFTSICVSMIEQQVRRSLRRQTDVPTSEPTALSCTHNLLARIQHYAILSDPLTLDARTVDAAAALVAAPIPPCASSLAHGALPEWTEEMCGMSLVSLHILCESCRLQEVLWGVLEPLAELCWRLSRLLGWTAYMDHYASSLFSEVEEAATPDAHPFATCLSVERLGRTFRFSPVFDPNDDEAPLFLVGHPPSLFAVLRHILHQDEANRGRYDWPRLEGLREGHPIQRANQLVDLYRHCFPSGVRPTSSRRVAPWWQGVCEQLVLARIRPEFLAKELCVGVAYPLWEAIVMGRDHPKEEWSDAVRATVGRLDLIARPQGLEALPSLCNDVVRLAEERAIGRQYHAALTDDHGVSMRHDVAKTWSDNRVESAQELLNTAVPIVLEEAEGEGLDAMHATLNLLSRRARALPVGRGMLTMCTQSFKVRDSIPIPPLNLDGRKSDGLLLTNMSPEATAEHLMWPTFHNGCAAGLRFLPLEPNSSSLGSEAGRAGEADGQVQEESTITRHWVVYQTRNVGCRASRAGLLLAAGILGHLKGLQLTDIFTLLATPQSQNECRDATATAVMLGLSCSFRGTSTHLVYRCLSMHIQSLNASAEEIEVSLDVQSAALVSLGLLCQQCTPCNRLLVEMLLNEMSRLPSDEHCMNREGYTLAAGFGLGLMLLGIGRSHGLSNDLEERLFGFLEGTRREPVPSVRCGLENFNETHFGSQKWLTRALLTQNISDAEHCSCTRVFEGDYYNVSVSGPAAVMALGLCYLRTDDVYVAGRLAPPNRLYGLQGLSPLLCLLRSLLSPLIAWSQMVPSREWLMGNVPSCLRQLAEQPALSASMPSQQRQYLFMNMGHCIAGSALALGLRYAGSMDADAQNVLRAELVGFMKGTIGTTTVPFSALQRSTGAFDMCISSCAIALSLVLAGTGDLKTFSLLQKLYRKTNSSYGTHMSTSMAMGLLFLGGGRLTLSNSAPSIGALLLSLYPMWPRHAEDNRDHLQALRHLYGLAVVPRVLETVDAISNRPVSVPVRVILRQGRVCADLDARRNFGAEVSWTPVPHGREEQEFRLQTPCLYPPADMIERIEVRSAQHYPLTIANQCGAVPERGLVVRVLEKSITLYGSHDAERKRHGANKHAQYFSTEARVRDGLHRLLGSQQGTSVVEALTMLESLKLLLLAQPLVSESTGDGGEGGLRLSLDFSRSLEKALQRRYAYLFIHGENTAHLDEPMHPVRALVMEGKPWRSVMSDIARHPNGTDSFPCDFTSLVATPMTAEGLEHAQQQPLVELPSLSRWIAESMCFFDLDLHRIPEVRDAILQHLDVLKNPTTRVVGLLRLSQLLMLPMATLDSLCACCVPR